MVIGGDNASDITKRLNKVDIVPDPRMVGTPRWFKRRSRK
jgi:hypothetical protein